MTQKHDIKTDTKRSERWIDGIVELARGRGDSEAVWRRAVDITRQLNIAPWVALAVAERILTLKEAPMLDRAARCEELRGAILDKRKRIDELKTSLPYAPYLLAVELVEVLGKEDWELRKVTAVAKGLLSQEKKQDENGLPMPVRTKSLDEYAAAVKRVRRLVERTGCSLRMALDVEAGRLSEAYVHQYVQQRRKLVHEELRHPENRVSTVKRPFPSHPSESGDARTAGS